MKKTLLLIAVFFLLMGCFDNSANSQGMITEVKNRGISVEGSGDTWLIMLYQNADDYQLEEDIVFDFNEAEYTDYSDNITVISQLDRYKGSYKGDGDWSGTRRYLITPDDDLDETTSYLLEDLGELNMASGETLSDFCIWAIENFPADKYAVIMSDHGSGWPGGWSDPDPDEGDMLWTAEMGEAMSRVLHETGLESMDLIGFDACLMGQLEVFATMAPYFKYAVASEETEPGIGWAYHSFIQALIQNPSLNGAGLATAIVDSYIHHDISVSEDVYRRPRTSGYSDFDYGEYLSADVTLSAIDLSLLGEFRTLFNELLEMLQYTDQAAVARARAYAQRYTNVFDESIPSPYIDLGHLLSLMDENIQDPDIEYMLLSTMDALENAVIAEKHGEERSASTGISIYFPNSELYTADWGGMESYAYAVPDFLRTYNWDEFLLAHYTSTNFTAFEEYNSTGEEESEEYYEYEEYNEVEEEPLNVYEDIYIAVPTEEEIITAPGFGEISIENMVIDQSSVSDGGAVTITADIIGENIAYIFLQVLYYDPESEFYLIADKDYIEADDTLENNGIYYPDWSSDENQFELEFEWDPSLYVIDVGNDARTFALVEPYAYGVGSEDTIYTVEGMYYSTAEEDEVYALCYFNGDGYLNEIYGFRGDYGLGLPYEIIPRVGDYIAPYESWVIFDEDGEPQYDYELGEYLEITNIESPIEWYTEAGFIGDYYIGFLVEDFDGNQVKDYVYVEVVE
ncbi:MAG: hypothetical protein JEY99_04445 [Spirochaetales bacterium]|nr:hypothetical protein [Spirochaetales bacterium]